MCISSVYNKETLSGEAKRCLGQDATCHRQSVVLLLALKWKDPHLATHSYRVQQLTAHFTQLCRPPRDEATLIELSALFHDIGKLAIPDDVLQKASPLTQYEFALIKQHSLWGALILNQVRMPGYIVRVVYHHHERWDGRGYPDGLRGEAIPLGARMIAIADAFEAMTSYRVYQKTRTPVQAAEELRRCAGTQFDPALVDHFCMSVLPFLSACTRTNVTTCSSGSK